jgi:putative methyltransferase (TIGR04325 family)
MAHVLPPDRSWPVSVDIVPGVRRARRRAYDRLFEQNPGRNLFRGVFTSAEAAVATAPKTRPLGYDNPESAAMYPVRNRPDAHDYPAMFWLAKAFDAGARTVFDVGGHVGLKWYAFRESVGFPPGLQWTVCDVPAVIARGATLAREKAPDAPLRFTADDRALDGCDLLFASGALQYLPMTLPEWLGGLASPPRHIVLNTTALHPEREFFTLNSTGTAFCPYRVSREGALVGALERMGWRAVDRWANVGKTLVIPFEDGYDLPEYRGMYLVRG